MAIRKEEKSKIIGEFQKSGQDTGSVEIQIALLTKNIRELTGHCQTHPKDFSSRRGLLKMVCRRRNFLRYLEKRDHGKYKEIIQKLGLRK